MRKFVFVGLFVCLMIALFLYQQKEFIQQKINQTIHEKIESLFGVSIELGHIAFSFPFNLYIADVKVGMGDDLYVHAENLEIAISPWPLLHQELMIRSITVEKLFLPESFSHGHPVPSSLVVTGSGKWNLAVDNGFFDLRLGDSKYPELTTSFAVNVFQEEQQMTAWLRIDEPSAHFISHLFSLPEGYDYFGNLKITGLHDSWRQLEIQGEMQLGYRALDTHALHPLLGESGLVDGVLSLSGVENIVISKICGYIGNIVVKGKGSLTNLQNLSGSELSFNQENKWWGTALFLQNQEEVQQADLSIEVVDPKLLEELHLIGFIDSKDPMPFFIKIHALCSYVPSMIRLELDGLDMVFQENRMTLDQTVSLTISSTYFHTTPWFLTVSSDLLMQPIQIFMNGTYEDRILTWEGHCSGLGIMDDPLSFFAIVPIQTVPTFFVQISGQGRLESLLDFFLPRIPPAIGADVGFAVQLSGSFSQPQMTGKIVLSNGSFELLDLGIVVNHISGEADLDGSIIVLKELTASENGANTLVATGVLDLNPLHGFPFELTAQIPYLHLSPVPYVNASGKGFLNFSGNRNGAHLKGKTISRIIDIEILEQIPELAQTVEVIYINQKDTIESSAQKMDWPIHLDLDIEIPGHCKIHGRDLESEWKGNVKLTGTTSELLANGSCKLIDGKYEFNGKTFQLSKGTITFAGSPEKKTSLYVIASRDLDNLKAEIILKGPLKHPAVSFRSNPPMPQREIVSWILFNRGSSEITPFQGTQLNESITNLGSAKQGPDVFTRIRERIGIIDRLDINHSQTESAHDLSLQVGKYLSEDILVSFNKSITAEAYRIAIEAKLFQNVKVQAEIGDNQEGQLQLKWKKDY